MNIPLAKPSFTTKEEKTTIDVLRSGWITQGPKVIEFEDKFAKFTHSKYAIAVSNCTSALHLALLAGDIKAGDEVIVPSYTFIASVNVILHCGATPVFVDVDQDTSNIDCEDVKRKLTKKTKAIIAVDQVGLPCDIDAIKKIAQKFNLFFIEDAACALGSRYKNKPIGGLADITCFSFHPRKVISTGEGGMLTTNSKKYANLARVLRSHGASVSDFSRHTAKKISFEAYKTLGYNYRLTDIQAAIGIEQLKQLPKFIKKRRNLAKRYNRELAVIPFIKTPLVPKYAYYNYQSYIIKVLDNSSLSQKEIMQKLLDSGVATRRGAMASHLEPFYKKHYKNCSLPTTEKLTKSTITLPLFYDMNIKQQDFVINLLKQIFK